MHKSFEFIALKLNDERTVVKLAERWIGVNLFDAHMNRHRPGLVLQYRDPLRDRRQITAYPNVTPNQP